MTLDSLLAFSLLDNTANQAIGTYSASTNNAMIIEYSITRGTNAEVGTIHLINNGSTVQLSSQSSQIGDCGTTFSAALSGGNIIFYASTTSTGTPGTLKFSAKRWQF